MNVKHLRLHEQQIGRYKRHFGGCFPPIIHVSELNLLTRHNNLFVNAQMGFSCGPM